MKNKVFGYCRISTAKQSIERQERNIKAAYPEVVIVREVYTGTKLQAEQNGRNFIRLLRLVIQLYLILCPE